MHPKPPDRVAIKGVADYPEGFFGRSGVALAGPDRGVSERPDDELHRDAAAGEAAGEGVAEIVEPEAPPSAGRRWRTARLR